MIHIVFQAADVETLKKAFELEPAMAGEVIELKDELAVGPIAGIFTPEGIETRKQWWREILTGGDYDGLELSGLDLTGASGEGARFLDCAVRGCALDGARLDGAEIQRGGHAPDCENFQAQRVA